MPSTPLPQSRTLLLATDSKNSLLAELAGGRPNSIAYAAYGHQSAQHEVMACVGFNGELRESQTSWYFLGNGYRVYNPRLMRFHSPDSWSPFGAGGLNAYMYCVDPLNFSDPSGHMKFFTNLTRRLNQGVNRASSTSSLSPILPSPSRTSLNSLAQNHGDIDNGAMFEPTYKTIPALTRKSRTHIETRTHIKIQTPEGVSNQHFIDYGPWSDSPPQIPSRQKPRFNDTGGQTGIISPNWKEGEDYRYREVWKRKPFEASPAPAPRTRTLPEGSTRHYFVGYDRYGNPRQSSVNKSNLVELQKNLRSTQN